MGKSSKSKRGLPRWGRNIFFVVGLMMIMGAWWVARDRVDLLRNGVSSSGVVIELVERKKSDGNSTYAPVVEVQSKEHGVFLFTSGMSSNPPSFSVGDKVEVIVDPDDRERAIINSFGQIWFVPIIMTIMGSGAAMFGLIGRGIFRWPGKKGSGGTGT